ncbi:MAG TPA: HlyD family secretion protein [Devosiaceae bacterium]|jgi:membrane fusion protein (multidrug efflux system)
MAQFDDKVRRFPRNAEAGDAAERPADEAPHLVPGDAPAAAPSSPPAGKPEKPKGKGGSRRKVILSIVALAAVAGAGWFGYNFYTFGRFMVSTDDAYVGGDIATIAPKIAGYVAEVNVVANQEVKAGDPLVTLDNADYTIVRDQAQAQIDTQNMSLKRFDAQIDGARAAVAQAEAQKVALQAAQKNAALARDRANQLSARNVSSQAETDQATAALDQANANLVAVDAQIAAANANVTVLQGQRNEAESGIRSLELARDKAERDLGFTVLRAPYDGIVGNLAVQKGDFVSPGARLAALVPVKDLYVEANFKETQLAQLVPGEQVQIHVDALDDTPIIGTVQSLSPASGSVFSLLPAENATGNFTKVVQRVPVRIALPADALASGKLRAGLSVVVDADTRTIPANH